MIAHRKKWRTDFYHNGQHVAGIDAVTHDYIRGILMYTGQ